MQKDYTFFSFTYDFDCIYGYVALPPPSSLFSILRKLLLFFKLTYQNNLETIMILRFNPEIILILRFQLAIILV